MTVKHTTNARNTLSPRPGALLDSPMQFAAVQFDIVWEDKPANHTIMEQMIDASDIAAGAFVLLPELGDTGFSFNLDTIVDDQTLPWAQQLASSRGLWVQAGFARRGSDGKGRNVAAIVNPRGEVVIEYAKVHPFSYGKEIEHFSGGSDLALCDVRDLHVAPLICYDLRFPELWRLAALAGADVFTIGASWPDARQHHWRLLSIARAVENQAYVVTCNRIGRDPSLGYAGGSMIVDPTGEVLAEADTGPAVITAEIDPAAIAAWRRKFPALRDIHRALLGDVDVRHTAGKPHDVADVR